VTPVRRFLLPAIAASLLAGCTVYEVAPAVYATVPATTFDRSWAAARNALLDQGVRISGQLATTIIVAQMAAGINGRRIQNEAAIMPTMNSTTSVVRVRSREAPPCSSCVLAS
jgi:uncharacterized lipoprotein YmbA